MLPLRLFERRNFSAGNVETFAVYAGLGILFLFLILFLQQIGGYSPLQSGLATLPMTLVMFLLSRRFGMLADRYGPRLFMGLGPLVGAVGLALFQRVGHGFSYLGDVLPAELVFALGLSMTVAPLTAAVLAGSEGEAGIASAVNNAVARVAGLIGTAGVGAVIAAAFSSSLKSHLRGNQPRLGRAGGAGGSQTAAPGAARRPRRCPTRRPMPCTPPPKRPRCTPSTSGSGWQRRSWPPAAPSGWRSSATRPGGRCWPRNAPGASWSGSAARSRPGMAWPVPESWT